MRTVESKAQRLDTTLDVEELGSVDESQLNAHPTVAADRTSSSQSRR